MNSSDMSKPPPNDHETWVAEAEKVARDGLLRFVLDAVEALDWPEKNVPFGPAEHNHIPSALLMVLEVYCYARGVFDTSEVVEMAVRHRELKPLFANREPTERIVKRFRRSHHEEIKQCLRKIFELALIIRFGDAAGDDSLIDFCIAESMDTWFAPICGPQPKAEAEMRVDQAVFADNVLHGT